MKKIVLLLSVVVAMTTSCKKDYTCSCTDSSTAPNYATTAYDVTITEAKKADAKRACVKTTSTSGGYTYTSDCKLK